MSRNKYVSSEHFWSAERNEHKNVDKGIRVLSNIDKKLQRAFEILERDDYGYMSRSSYSGISGRIERCKEKNEKVWNYASTIHGILSDKENDFHRALSEAMEELSLLNINDYEVDNTLGIKEYYTYTDYSNSYGYQGTSNAKLITAERVKAKINFADIMAKTDMFGLDQQFKQYLKEEKKNIYEMSDKEIAEYRNKFYTDTLTTSFNHKMESNLEGISEFLDYVPVIGGLKGLMEGCTGYTMTGEKLTNSERISMGVLGTLSLAVDVATLGALSATTQGAKALAKEVGKVAFADIVIAGYGTKYTSEVMRNLGMSPEQVMMAHMLTSLAVGGYSSYKNYKKNLSDIMKNAGLDNIDQAKDLMKYTGLSSKDLAKRLENSSIESILGIDKKNLDYLMNKTNMSEVDILTELKKQNIDIDKINGLNVDEILKKLDKESRPKFDIDIAQQKLNEIRSRMPNQNLKIRGNMAIADVAVEGLPNEFVAHSKIHNLASKGANVDNFSFTRENKFFETYVDDGFPRYNDTEAKILEDIASKIKDPNISGRINLFTELPACQSCTNIIFEFRRRFPNIELNIFTK